jgi:hypothetical protein
LTDSCSASARGGGDDLGAFFAGAGLGLLDHLLRQPLGIGQALGGVVAGGGQLLLDALVGGGQVGLGLVGGRQAVGDLGARSSSAFMIGGQTNFIVNQTRIAKTIIWTIRVALMLTS